MQEEEQERELLRSCHRDRIESRYIIIESTVSRNAVDETSILENREIFIASYGAFGCRARVYSSTFSRVFSRALIFSS